MFWNKFKKQPVVNSYKCNTPERSLVQPDILTAINTLKAQHDLELENVKYHKKKIYNTWLYFKSIEKDYNDAINHLANIKFILSYLSPPGNAEYDGTKDDHLSEG